MYKKYTHKTKSGTEAIVIALKQLDAKNVIIPTYTCTDILNAVKQAECKYTIVDCGYDLQIDTLDVISKAKDHDTVIVPHMFGIRADVKTIKEKTSLKIIEDLSQCHGLPELGKYSDIVISSTNKSKWIDFKGGGFIFSDNKLDLSVYDFSKHKQLIKDNFDRRIELASEITEAGVRLIGKESAWLRGMYFTSLKSTRRPYTPLHVLENIFGCVKVDSYIDKVNWISIIV